jgi:hypothetical protein
MTQAADGFSGQYGTVTSGASDLSDPSAPTDVVCEVTKWTLDPTAAISSYHSNKSGGHKKKVGGVRDTKGTIEIKIGATDGQQLQPGDVIALRLYANGSDAETLVSTDYFDIQEAVIAGAPVECDIDNGEVVGLTYNFEASHCAGSGIFA